MSEGRSNSEERPRSAPRMGYVAPPGLDVDGGGTNLTTIGRYEILEALGRGAMGLVYKARDPLLDRIVALKTIVSPRGGGRRTRRSYLERFEREAKAAAKMQHPAIVTIFDIGTEGGQPFMVLEYLPGDSLADRLDKVRMPLGKAVQTAAELAGALGFAHRERIVHRDVKPANVLSAGDSSWKLADFGIARVPNSELTQVGIFMGTPGYAPPEAIRQGEYTPQADVFAWGAVFYELLSGRIPYEGPDTRTTNSYVLQNTAVSPREYDASIPALLADVCMTALHPSPLVRYEDGHQARLALEQAWERCIGEELVGNKALSGREIPHERASRFMHVRDTDAHAVSLPVPIDTDSEGDSHKSTVAGDEEVLVRALDSSEIRSRDSFEKVVASSSDSKFNASKREAHNVDVIRDARRLLTHAPKPGVWVVIAFSAILSAALATYYLLHLAA